MKEKKKKEGRDGGKEERKAKGRGRREPKKRRV